MRKKINLNCPKNKSLHNELTKQKDVSLPDYENFQIEL